MAKIHESGDQVCFWCPGCNEAHRITVHGQGPKWNWNGSLDSPTFTPSVKVTNGHYVPDWNGGACWCTYNAEHPDAPASFKCEVCHSLVADGKIQFLHDCTHKLAGQTVDIPDWED